MSSSSAQLIYQGKTLNLPVLSGSDGPDVLDIRELYSSLNLFTYDPGFTVTANCESKITFIDGEDGRLL